MGNEMDENHNKTDETKSPMERIDELKTHLSSYPTDYNSHLSLISACKEADDNQQLEDAREAMSNVFPLTEKLWLEWIGDTKENDKVNALFEKAVLDYMCPNVWFEYMQHAVSWLSQPDGVAKIRAVMERGITACGLHVTQGQQLWETYREFEIAIASSKPNPDEEDKRRINTLYRRQLVVPLSNMEDAWDEYEDWLEEDETPDANLERTHVKMCDLYNDQLKIFEDKLQEAGEGASMAIYDDYLTYELSHADPTRVQCLYERAITDNCLNEDLWIRYINYITTKLKGNQVVLSVLERGVRNCPWSSVLWVKYMVAMETFGMPDDQMDAVFKRSLAAGYASLSNKVDVWKALCDHARRKLINSNAEERTQNCEKLRNLHKQATEDISTLIDKSNTDTSYIRLWLDYAYDEASCMNDLDKAHKVIESVTRNDPKVRRNPIVWLECYQMELSFNKNVQDRIKRCRTLLREGVQRSAIDMHECTLVCEALTQFERRFGTLEDIAESQRRVAEKLEQIRRRELKSAHSSETRNRKRENTSDRHQKNEHQPGGKRAKREEDGRKEEHKKHEVKQQKTPEKAKVSTKEKSSVKPPPGFTKPKEDEEHKPVIKKGLKPDNLSPAEEKCTVFISNLDFKLTDVDEKLSSFFKQFGTVKDIRIITDYKGSFRGYAYIQFEDTMAADKALASDRSNFEGRPLFVSPYVDKTTNPTAKVFKYENKIEQHKLFIKNLPIEMDEDGIRTMFGEFGSIRAVRINTRRDGVSKGIAYIEYEEKKCAANAVLGMNDKEIDGKQLIVAISNPPKRNRPETSHSNKKSEPVTVRRTQISFKPRAVSRNEQNTIINNKPMSNKDFAKMLMKK